MYDINENKNSEIALWQRGIPVLLLVLLAFLSRFPYIFNLVVANAMVPYGNLCIITKNAILPGRDTIDLNVYSTALALGHRAIVDWTHGIIPWWNPYEGIGVPLAGGMLSAALFFPFILLLCTCKGQIFFYIILQCLAGLSTYFLLRHLGISRMAAFTGAALFELNGTFVWLRCQPCNPIAFLPLLLLGIEQALTAAKNNKFGGWGIVTLALAGSLYAGFPEVAYINGLLAAVWTFARTIQLSFKENVLFAKKLFFGTFVGLMLAAPILVAFIGYLPEANVGTHHLMEHESVSTLYLPQIFIPYIYGQIFNLSDPQVLSQLWSGIGGYLGAAPLFFCLLSLFGRKERILRFALVGWILFALGKTFNIYPISDIFNLVPFIKETIIHRYCSSSCEFVAFFLIALALDDLCLKANNKNRSLILACLAVSLIATLPWLLATPLLSKLATNHDFVPWINYSIIAALFFSISTSLIAIFVPTEKLKISLVSILIITEAFCLFLPPAFAQPQKAIIKLDGVHFLQQHLGMQRFFTLGPFLPNLGSYFGVASINYDDMPLPKRWTDYVASHLYKGPYSTIFSGVWLDANEVKPSEQLLNNLHNYEWVGVKYIVAPPNANPFLKRKDSSPNIQCVYQDQVMDIYELPNPSPYFEVNNNSAHVSPLSRLELDVDCLKESTLVRRELFFPGWTAMINDCHVPITEYKQLFQSIQLPPGHNHIAFSYTPPYMWYASVAFFAAWVFLIAGNIRILGKLTLR